MEKRGEEFRKLRKKLGLTDIDVCHEAKVSISALYKFYRDNPTVHANTRGRVEGAFATFQSRSKASA